MESYTYEGSTYHVPDENDPEGLPQGSWYWTMTLRGDEAGTNRPMVVTRTGTVDPSPHLRTRADLQRQVYNLVLGGLTALKPGAAIMFQDLQFNESLR